MKVESEIQVNVPLIVHQAARLVLLVLVINIVSLITFTTLYITTTTPTLIFGVFAPIMIFTLGLTSVALHLLRKVDTTL